MSKIYISGPITGTADYMERFAQAEEFLKRRYNLPVFNPAKINAQLPKGSSYADYMAVSLALLSRCNVIYMLDGWIDSKGANLEFAYAVAHGYRIIKQYQETGGDEKCTTVHG